MTDALELPAAIGVEAAGPPAAPPLASRRDVDQRVAGVVSVAEFEAIAKERMDRIAYDYVAGGAWDELSLANNVAAWRRRTLRPRVLVDVARVDASTTFLGLPAALPLAVAPMAAHGLAHPDGEVATARAAASAGVPFVLSTMSSRSIEEVAASSPEGTRWFQLYTQRDPSVSRLLVERAEAAGYRAVVLTVDLPVFGYRERDLRNGFDLSVPLGNFPGGRPGTDPGESGYQALEERRLAGPTWDDVATIRGWSGLPLVLKGILTAEDARLAIEHGADGIIVSNHGARQLDRVPAAIDVLEEVLGAVDGTVDVWVDGGVRRGLDIAIAIALGARGVLVGRPVFYALASGGETGVARALAILRLEFETALTLLGARRPAELARSHVGS
ncbi:MAG TPA: alpha-hydroxy acid oxidase [Candidatus Limnocylindrales bacterium]